MTAIESVLSETERRELGLVERYGAPDKFIDHERDTLWHPWVGDLELMPLRFEARTGTFVVVLRAPTDAVLGKHRHRGTVTAVTLKGSWNYFEYDWVARPGDYVVEAPGTIHTLHMGEGAEVVFTVTGSIEFLNSDDSLNFTFDIFSLADLYTQHCAATGRPVNQGLFY